MMIDFFFHSHDKHNHPHTQRVEVMKFRSLTNYFKTNKHTTEATRDTHTYKEDNGGLRTMVTHTVA